MHLLLVVRPEPKGEWAVLQHINKRDALNFVVEEFITIQENVSGHYSASFLFFFTTGIFLDKQKWFREKFKLYGYCFSLEQVITIIKNFLEWNKQENE